MFIVRDIRSFRSSGGAIDCLRAEALGGDRARFGASVVDRVGVRLEPEFGLGLVVGKLRRVTWTAEAFVCAMVVSLSRQMITCHNVTPPDDCREPVRQDPADEPAIELLNYLSQQPADDPTNLRKRHIAQDRRVNVRPTASNIQEESPS